MTKTLLLISAFLFSRAFLFAQDKQDTLDLTALIKKNDSIENSLHYKTGKIDLGNGIASINVPQNFKFLESAEAKYVIETVWGNPPSSSAPLGLLMPASSGATDPGSYAFIVQFEDLGYVKDNDADKVDYDDLLKNMKEGSVKDNEERKKLGYQTMDLVGWAEKPYYDKDKKVLHWAKEFSVPGAESNTLNYDIRVLGRKGVLTLEAVSSMKELDSVNHHINDVLGMVAFNEGHRYSDFNSSTDNVAAWTIGGLVAGKILAKVGFFAVILKFLKFIIAGIVLAGGAIWRFITGRKKKEEEFVYQPQPSPNNDEPTNPPV